MKFSCDALGIFPTGMEPSDSGALHRKLTIKNRQASELNKEIEKLLDQVKTLTDENQLLCSTISGQRSEVARLSKTSEENKLAFDTEIAVKCSIIQRMCRLFYLL